MKRKILWFLILFTNILVGQYATLPFSDNFEGTGTSLGANWSTEYQDGNAVIDRRNELGAWPKLTFGASTKGSAYTSSNDPSGNGMAIYRTANATSAKYQSAILSVDLYNKGGITVSFNIVDWGTGYGGSLDSLKIYISNDGGTTYGSSFLLINLNQSPYNDGYWNTVNADISTLATTNSMILSATSKIKFTFNLKGSGNTTSPKSGNQFIYMDNFTVTTTGGLPVELISFNGKKTKLGNLIEWMTASEINNDYFELLSSVDGINFIPITTIDGAGNSNSILTYNYLDNTNKTTYYKLKQVDYDGTTTYSEVIILDGESFFSITTYDGKLFINGEGLKTLTIYDLTGKLVCLSNLDPTSQFQSIQLEDYNLSSEIYIININAFSTIYVEKMLIK